MNRYGIPLQDLASHCLDAVDAAERALSRTLVVRDGHAVAAIVPMTDLDRIDPPDPAAGGTDPLLSICGTCQHDMFVDSLSNDLDKTSMWHRHTMPVVSGPPSPRESFPMADGRRLAGPPPPPPPPSRAVPPKPPSRG